MNEIIVKSENLKEAIAAFALLFGRQPQIWTADRSFDDSRDVTCWGRVPVVQVGRTLFVYSAEGETFKAPIANVKEFKLK